MGNYDKACLEFTSLLAEASAWKHSYYGAAYTTRIKQAIQRAREACDSMEDFLKDTGEW